MIQTVPSQLVFTYNPSVPLKAFISLKNKSSSLLAFKVKSTAIEQFEVSPYLGELKPGQSKSIEFRSFNVIDRAPGKALLSQAKFMVQCVPINQSREAENDQIWRNKSLVESHKLKIRWDGFDGDYPLAETQIPYTSARREAPIFINPAPPLVSRPSKKTRSFNKIIVILLLLGIGIVFGYGLRWYKNYKNSVIVYQATSQATVFVDNPETDIQHNIPHHHQQVSPIDITLVEKTDDHIQVKFKITQAAPNDQYNLHIDLDGKVSISFSPEA